MIEYFKKRRAKKREILQQVKNDKRKHKERKQEIAALSDEKRMEAIESDKQLRKEQKQQRKAEIKSLDGKAKRKAKKEAKIYKKLKNRPRRFTGWAIVGILIAFIFIQIGPTAMNLLETISGKHITIDTDSPEAIAAREEGDQLSEEIANEGIVLLKNEDDHLPLNEKKVNVFGLSSFDFRYGGGGSGGADLSRAVSLYDGLKNAGITYNSELYDMYRDIREEQGIEDNESTGIMQVVQGMFGNHTSGEPSIDYLSEESIEQAQSYSENALIVIASAGAEASDMSEEQLQITENKRDLIEKVTANFENVTIVVNAGNTLEMGFIEEYDSIKSVVWVGTPGPYGTNSLGNVLAGNINPSGRLTDTYVYDNQSSPASENFGDYQYDNLDYSFINYQEGIYVGYRFYETYFANDEEGYQETVLYPYGYGLSYTDFEWNVTEQRFSEESIEVEVEVTNVGDVSGKEVVQLYYSAPYIDGEIEKAAIEMATFEKTSLLEPDESVVLTLSFDTKEMASYDMRGEEAYVMDPGTYEIKVARNVHDIVESYDYELSDRIVYEEDPETGTPYENQFELAEGEIAYLSRDDWENTYPSDENISHEAPQYVVDAFNEELEDSNQEMPTFGEDNGLRLEELKGVDYDDPKWDQFLDQLTLDEMYHFVTEGAYKTNAIERLGVPKTLLMDGPAGFSYFFQPITAAAYPSEIVIASTWNKDLAYQMGEAVGNEARAYGIQGWYAPGMNIHRTAQGGRNFEYFSEDPILSGKIAASITKGAQDQGIIVFMKHFALNDQETNARSGNFVWANEQAIREIYLKPFEMTVKEADVLGAMSSFAMIGGEWSGSNSNLLQNVLRDEWGFRGFVSSDAVFGFMKTPDAIVAGNDLMLDTMSSHSQRQLLEEAYDENPSAIANGVRDSVHRIMYTILETYLFEE